MPSAVSDTVSDISRARSSKSISVKSVNPLLQPLVELRQKLQTPNEAQNQMAQKVFPNLRNMVGNLINDPTDKDFIYPLRRARVFIRNVYSAILEEGDDKRMAMQLAIPQSLMSLTASASQSFIPSLKYLIFSFHLQQ